MTKLFDNDQEKDMFNREEITREVFEALKAKGVEGVDMEAKYYIYPDKIAVKANRVVLSRTLDTSNSKEVGSKDAGGKDTKVKGVKKKRGRQRNPTDLVAVDSSATHSNLKSLSAQQKQRWDILMTAYKKATAVQGKELSQLIAKKVGVKNGSEAVNLFITKGFLRVLK